DINTILSIGLWNKDLAVITTDLQLYLATLNSEAVALKLSHPEALANREAQLSGALFKLTVSASDNLIQIILPSESTAVPPALVSRQREQRPCAQAHQQQEC